MGVKVWTEWCGCGVNEICEEVQPQVSKIAGMRSGICKSPRCNSENDCHSFYGSKCRDVKVGPFSHIESENALNKEDHGECKDKSFCKNYQIDCSQAKFKIMCPRTCNNC